MRSISNLGVESRRDSLRAILQVVQVPQKCEVRGLQRSYLYGEHACAHTTLEKAFSDSDYRPKWIGCTNCLKIGNLRRAAYILRAKRDKAEMAKRDLKTEHLKQKFRSKNNIKNTMMCNKSYSLARDRRVPAKVTLRLVRSKKKQTEGVREWRAGCPAQRSETKKKRASGRLTPPRGPDRSEAESDAAERVERCSLSWQSQVRPFAPHATARDGSVYLDLAERKFHSTWRLRRHRRKIQYGLSPVSRLSLIDRGRGEKSKG